MTRRAPPTTPFALFLAAHLVGSSLFATGCGGPTDAQRLRMSGVHVAAREEPVDAGPPPGTETRLLPHHRAAGDTYRRVDESSVEVNSHILALRIDRTITVEEVDSAGIATYAEKVTSYVRTVDGRVAAPSREERDLEAATIRYHLSDLGLPVGELEILGAGRFNESLLRWLGQTSFADDGLDRSTDMAVGARRSGDMVVNRELENNVRSDLRMHLTYTLVARSEREARFEIDGTASLTETQVGRYKVRGTGNVSGRWIVDPRDGLAGISTAELRIYASRRDAHNRPISGTTTFIFRGQTSITKR